MKPGIPWSVKGIEPEVREAAKFAARRSGMTLGEWLNNVILEQADDAAPAAPPPRPSYRRDEPRDAVRLEDIAEQLARIARRDQDTTPAPYAATRQADQEALGRILNRVESNERQTVEAFSAVNERLSAVGRQVSQLAQTTPSARSTTKPEDTPAFQSLEKAVRNIIEHIENGERRTRDTLKTMQDRMADMATRAAGSVNEQVLQQAPAIRNLEARISELANRIDRTETGKAVALPELLQRELSQLAGRIDGVRQDSEALASRAQTAAVQASQKELRTIEQRILTLLKDAQSAFASQNGTPAEMQRLRGEVETLNQRIDQTRQGLASDRDVTALRTAVEQLSTRVAQSQDLRPLADLDRRVTDIHERLEQTQGSMAHKPQLTDLERRMAEMDRRLSEAMSQGAAPIAQSALENQITAMAERLARAESQLTSLDTIERAVNQLYDAMEQTRTTSEKTAEEAARRVAAEFSGAAQPMAAMAAMDAAPEIQALQDGLRAVRETAASADQRNQETLQAVHDTLEQIVSKLAELENNALAQPAVGTMAAAPAMAETAPPAMPAAAEIFAEPPIFDANPFTPEAVEATAPANPFAGVQASAAEAAPGSVDDIIAAARRMAQASNAHKSVLAGVTPGAAGALAGVKSTGVKSLLSRLPFFNRGPKAPKAAKPEKPVKPLKGSKVVPGVKPDGTKTAPEIKSAANDNDARRKRLMLLGLLLLAAVSAYTMNIFGQPRPAPLPVEPAAVQQPAAPPPAATAVPQPAASAPVPLPAETPQVMPGSATDTAPAAIDGAAPAPAEPAKVQGSLDITSKATTIASLLAADGGLTTASITPPAVVQAGAPPVEMPPAELGAMALRQSARDGDATAQFIIATRYLDGGVVKQDSAKAAEWYERAAQSGLAPAQYRLATLYERGTGVTQDFTRALSLYEKAGRQGNIRAMHNAASIAASGNVGKPDYTRAVYWFRQAADHGLKDSQFNLAVLIERGLGTVPSGSDALFWYSLAAQQKDTDASNRAAVLARSLSPAMVDDVKKRVASWQPKRTMDVANVVAVTRGDWNASGTAAAPEAVAPVVNSDIAEVQTLLNGLGYSIGTPDGRMGSRTANAIRLFQMQNGFKVTGEATPEIVAALKAKKS